MLTRQRFTKENFKKLLEYGGWKTYQKKVKTKATKIEGEFIVDTSEGPLHCVDGYLAVDARGYPYPIATEEFKLIYEEVED